MYNVRLMTKQEQHDQLKSECLKCSVCKLAEKRTQVVFADGDANCDIMMIGEAPGADEDAQGIPFVGRAGKLLTKIIESVGFVRGKDVYITNMCKCRPPENRNPSSEEVNACRHWLEDQIKVLQPKIIVLVGAVALNGILGDKYKITKARGQWFEYDGIDTTVIFHPSYLLRNPLNDVGKPKWLTWQDMKAIKSALEYKQEEIKA